MNLKNIQQNPKLKILQLQNYVTVKVPDDVLDKIKFLCKNISKEEWSGILFYTIEGSIKDISSCSITCKDILLMDKGDKSFTSYDFNEDVIEYRMNNPKSDDWLVGHIHSHNTMPVFFSGTDMEELNDNCTAHNFYLSLIVNNFMDMEAKIAMQGKSSTYLCLDEKGINYNLKLDDKFSESVMFIYKCNIETNSSIIKVPDEFSNRLNDIINKPKVTNIITSLPPNKSVASQTLPMYTPGTPSLESTHFFSKDNGNNIKDFIEKEEDETLGYLDELFTAFLLRLGRYVNRDDIGDALIELNKSTIPIDDVIDTIIKNYQTYYNDYFDKELEYSNDTAYVKTMEDVIENLSIYDEDYDFVKRLINSLTKYKEQYIKENNYGN